MGHTYANILVHVIFSTRDRARLLDTDLRPRLYPYMAGVARHEFGRALDIGWVHKTFPQHQAFAWQSGYGAFSVSQSAIDAVRAYIARQAEHHRRVTFEEELRALLDRHGVPYDPAHVVD
jgi:putative transposase